MSRFIDNANLFLAALRTLPNTVVPLPDGVVFQYADGSGVPIAASGKGVIRYNDLTKTFQISVDGQPFEDISASPGGGVSMTSVPLSKVIIPEYVPNGGVNGPDTIVDFTNGNDGTGQRNDPAFPFKTYDAAKAVVLPGDQLRVIDGIFDTEDIGIDQVIVYFNPGTGIHKTSVSPTQKAIINAGNGGATGKITILGHGTFENDHGTGGGGVPGGVLESDDAGSTIIVHADQFIDHAGDDFVDQDDGNVILRVREVLSTISSANVFLEGNLTQVRFEKYIVEGAVDDVTAHISYNPVDASSVLEVVDFNGNTNNFYQPTYGDMDNILPLISCEFHVLKDFIGHSTGALNAPFRTPQEAAIASAPFPYATIRVHTPKDGSDYSGNVAMPQGTHEITIIGDDGARVTGDIVYDDPAGGTLLLTIDHFLVTGNIIGADDGSGSAMLVAFRNPQVPLPFGSMLNGHIDTSAMTGENLVIIQNGAQISGTQVLNLSGSGTCFLEGGLISNSGTAAVVGALACLVPGTVTGNIALFSSSGSLLAFNHILFEGSEIDMNGGTFVGLRSTLTGISRGITFSSFVDPTNMSVQVIDAINETKHETIFAPEPVAVDNCVPVTTIVNGGPTPLSFTSPKACGRKLQITISDAGGNLTSGNVQISGVNSCGEAVGETFTIIGGDQMFFTAKNYFIISSFTILANGATGAETVQAGFEGDLGVVGPFFSYFPVPGNLQVYKELTNGDDVTGTGTVDADARTIAPFAQPNGVNTYDFWFSHLN